MAAKNEAEVKETQAQTYSTGLDKQIGAFLPMVESQLKADGENLDEYAKYCVVAAIGEIVTMLHNSGLSSGDINGNNLNDILLTVARLKLNANAVPRECYFQIRSVNVTPKAKNATWEKQVEFNIEGDGYDSLVARYGRNVKKVYPYWLVREGDTYIPPKHKGLEVTPPEWEESGQGNAVRVVYPIEYTDGHIEYHSAERADVAKNLAAHIQNNIQNETFGICADRYNATPEQKAKIAEKKRAIMDKVKGLETLEAILECEELKPYISPSYSELQSQESMIIRKMRKNIMSKIPKDFGKPSVANAYNTIVDGVYREVQEEIAENANTIPFEPEAQIEEKPAPPAIPNSKAVEKESSAVKTEKQALPPFMQD